MHDFTMFELDGKVAVVTGAAAGLGAVFAEAMAEAGADVVCADIETKGMKKTVSNITKRGRKAIAVQCDVSKEDDCVQLMKKTVKTFGRLDILFNNAGIVEAEPKPLHECTNEAWNSVLAVDLHGVFFCAREALKIMVSQKSGKIINIASIFGLTGSGHLFPVPVYNTAKGAVVNLTREMGLEYAPLGINVNALCPGFFVTNIGGGKSYTPEFDEMVSSFTPIGMQAQPEELKGAAIFLASAASNYMCGQVLVVDGGCTAK